MPFLISLADAPGRSLGEIQIHGPKSDDFGGAAAGGVEGLQDRAVATAQPGQWAGRFEQAFGGRGAEHRRQAIPDRGRDQELGDVFADAPFEHQKAEEGREARQVPADAARRKTRAVQRVDIVAQGDRVELCELDRCF